MDWKLSHLAQYSPPRNWDPSDRKKRAAGSKDGTHRTFQNQTKQICPHLQNHFLSDGVNFLHDLHQTIQ